MLGEMSSRQIAEWMAFYEDEPFGDEWRQAGTIAAAAVGPYVEKGKKISPEDFMPSHPPKEHLQQSSADMLAVFKAMAGVKE